MQCLHYSVAKYEQLAQRLRELIFAVNKHLVFYAHNVAAIIRTKNEQACFAMLSQSDAQYHVVYRPC